MEKVNGHMRDKYTKRDIKLEHNSMNIIAYRVRRRMVVDAILRLMEEFERSHPWCRMPPGS
jgi:hypothetical protein